MTSLFLYLLLVAGEDPRTTLVALQHEDRDPDALAAARQVIADDPDLAQSLGIEYLEGRLLEGLDRPDEAVRAYVRVMNRSRELRPYALFRIAKSYVDTGHPELAAGLLAALLREPTPPQLLGPAYRLLSTALRAGGDCRVLVKLETDHLPENTRRGLRVLSIDCDMSRTPQSLRGGPRPHEELVALIEKDGTDLPAGRAAHSLATIMPAPPDARIAAVVGTSLHHHRQFDLAARFLERAVAELSPDLGRQGEYDTYYQLIRSWFWQGDFIRAAAGYGQLAQRSLRPEQRSQALYNEGRSFELMGDWSRAAASYRRAFLADENGRFSGAALISALRIEWRTGQEERAREIIDLLPTQRAWGPEAARAALFLAVSDLVRGRSDRAAAWLAPAGRGFDRNNANILFWGGRLAEIEGDREAAVNSYLALVADDAYQLLSRSAAQRLSQPHLRAVVEPTLHRYATATGARELHLAWQLLGDTDPDGKAAGERLRQRLARSPANLVYLKPATPATPDWPIWQASLGDTEEKLLALGLWHEGDSVVLRHFPVSQPALAMIAGHGLAGDGKTRRALYIAEILRRRLPREVPEAMVARSFRELLYPYPYRDHIEKVAARHGVDTSLLLAIVREESRFDPEAISPASARGLGQLTLSTARRVADEQGVPLASPDDLLDPKISLELAAAYLGELTRFFDGNLHQVVAAYNAGEYQATLWRTHCYSKEPEEYLAKVGFNETNAYLARVLRSRAQYAELYR
ncbi:MAG: transglycosylase SLT domain-containing protein [Acidobacteriota bacterium]|nr:transglycosylase SLT domain-containing protein [Acidobacteriota bacterium]